MCVLCVLTNHLPRCEGMSRANRWDKAMDRGGGYGGQNVRKRLCALCARQLSSDIEHTCLGNVSNENVLMCHSHSQRHFTHIYTHVYNNVMNSVRNVVYFCFTFLVARVSAFPEGKGPVKTLRAVGKKYGKRFPGVGLLAEKFLENLNIHTTSLHHCKDDILPS